MAGDWIKTEHTLPDKPEVIRMAAMLEIDQDAVTGKLLRIWIWADQNSVSGENIPVTTAFLDRLVDCKGFTAAMVAVGWLAGGHGDFTLPNFSRHNGASAKARAETNRRVAKTRSIKKSTAEKVAEKVLQNPLPEKSREEKKETTSPTAVAVEAVGVGDGSPKDETSHSTGKIANLHAIKSHINALRPEWSKPAQWNYAEEHQLFGGTASQLEEMSPADWSLLKRYLSARMSEGSTYWQPRNRAKFVETFASVFADAQRWESKQRRPAPPPAAPPVMERAVISRDQLSQVFGRG